MKKFTKSEKKRCKFYDWGRCKLKISGKDCRPITECGFPADSLEECKGFKEKNESD